MNLTADDASILSLYPKIHATQPELAGKLTGMLLEMDSAEILFLLENKPALDNKVRFPNDLLSVLR